MRRLFPILIVAMLVGASGALASLAVLAALRFLPKAWFGPVTFSIAAAYAHIAGQLAVVYLWLMPHLGLLYFVPVFAAAALLFGTVNGLAAARLLEGENLR